MFSFNMKLDNQIQVNLVGAQSLAAGLGQIDSSNQFMNYLTVIALIGGLYTGLYAMLSVIGSQLSLLLYRQSLIASCYLRNQNFDKPNEIQPTSNRVGTSSGRHDGQMKEGDKPE